MSAGLLLESPSSTASRIGTPQSRARVCTESSPLRRQHRFVEEPLDMSITRPVFTEDRFVQRVLDRKALLGDKRVRANSNVFGRVTKVTSEPESRFGVPGCPLLTRYCRGIKETTASLSSRNVPSVPERVLDAPGLRDDFYLNLLDWGKRDLLGVALGPAVYLWSGRDASVKELLHLEDDEAYISSLRWIHDGTSVGVGTSDGCVQVWDASAAKRVRTIVSSPMGHRISSIAWNRHLLSTGARDGTVCTFDVRIARPLVLSHDALHTQEVCGLAWSPDGRQLASGSNDNLVHVWDAGQAGPSHVFAEHRAAVRALAWAPWRSGLLATGGGSQDRCIKTWNTLSGECIGSVCADAAVSSLTWSALTRELVSTHGHPRNHIRFWNVAPAGCTNRSILTPAADIVDAHAARILHAGLSPDGQCLATAGADEAIKFWRPFEDAQPAIKPKVAKSTLGATATTTNQTYVLMPTFSGSKAVQRALNRQATAQ